MDYSIYLMFYSFSKRIIDLTFALLLLLLSLPLLILIAIILFIILREIPFLIQQRRLSNYHNEIKIIKIKTFLNDKSAKNINGESILLKPSLKERIPYFAGILRKTGLDELPQLINVISGELSLIGPRPLMQNDIDKLKNEFTSEYLLREKLIAKPGISGLWQIFGQREKGIQNLIALDNFYENNKSLSLDLKIFIATIMICFTGNNSDAILNVNRTKVQEFILKFFRDKELKKIFNSDKLPVIKKEYVKQY